MNTVINFFNEIVMLSKLQRSGYAFLGNGDQSVAEHTLNTIAIGYALAKLSTEPVDEHRLIKICLFHDLPESRIGDHNYVQKRYISTNMKLLYEDIKAASPFGTDIVNCIEEFDAQETREAQLARDADHIEMLIILKQTIDRGNPHAQEWYNNVEKRIMSSAGKKLAHEIKRTSSNEWWKPLSIS